jgi:bacteriocin biosynthesis cyclodehydratase domain-containing protein
VAGDSERVIYVKYGGGVHVLRGRDARAVVDYVLPWIDGSATLEEIVAAATQNGAVASVWVEKVLRWMIDTGMCVEDREEPGDEPFREHFLAQIMHFGQHVSFPTMCQKRLQASRVAVIGLEYIGSTLIQQLAAAGIGHLRAVGNPWLLPTEAAFVGDTQDPCSKASRHALLARRTQALGFATQYEGIEVQAGEPLEWERLLADCDLAVLVLPRWIPSLIKAFNQAGLARRIPFLPVWIEEACGHVGPLVIPYETACLLCLELRRRSRWTREDLLEMQERHAETTGPAWEGSYFSIPWVSVVASVAACEIVTTIAQDRHPASRGHELWIDARDWRLQPTPVLKVPRCPACGRLRDTPSLQPFALCSREARRDGLSPAR